LGVNKLVAFVEGYPLTLLRDSFEAVAEFRSDSKSQRHSRTARQRHQKGLKEEQKAPRDVVCKVLAC